MSTIVALATPPGIGALHVIRVSGSEAFEILNRISINPVLRTEDRIQVTFLKSRNNKLIDQVVLSKFYAPHSYTGEDCIEISCHGNSLISKLIIEEILKNGAVHAKRGEFTKRAFLNNKIDLNQAISIGNLFAANSEGEIYSFVEEIKGATSKLIHSFIEELSSIRSECEMNIDYPPDIEVEDSKFIGDIQERISSLHSKLLFFLESSKKQKLSGFRVVLVGRPNAGKSSLINHLIGKDKIIVSPEAGTTRDTVEVDYQFDDYLLTLVDTAGIYEVDDFLTNESIRRSKDAIRDADLLVHLVSLEDKKNLKELVGEFGGKSVITIFTKSDLFPHTRESNCISVKNSEISEFLRLLRNHLKENYSSVGVKSQEGINHLNNSCLELEKSLGALSLDLIAEHLNFAHDHLCRIVGLQQDSFEKINYLFDNFCIGK
ncbi:tRNA modification GTPase [Mycoplasma haemofelis str. Langford 1]|uniref:tRNA modification GTPase MnmE n=1 Tax=Mycoplasma haemofelis (strain Langford 1) TaxID=941640 RepID=E8ZK33_MYCHL|nr:tRNA uridine-5-carboxymethylaminomethyl(34) synthesis GTPase MnmE [Mycoplasma haemofelis]CBY93504.1 tRNA modification GTPase [Mycoplasma haemofelis str. Langford 1]